MSRTARFTPPDMRGDPVLRPAVHRALNERFDRSLTVVAAGAGFGKTTALLQMLAENRLAPCGVDRWLACEPADRDGVNFAAGIAAALEIDESASGEGFSDAVVEAFSSLAPAEVCLVIDDAHHLGPAARSSEASILLARLIERLPANGHVLLATRAQPPIAVSRLVAAGDCFVIGEDDLRLDDAQVEAIADAAGLAATDFSGLAGWPALVALAVGKRRPVDFVREEILGDLDADESALLDGLVAVGEADAGLLAVISGVDDESALDAIPLVHRRGERYAAHELWTGLLGESDRVARMRADAVEFLIGNRRFVDAVELCLASSGKVAPERLDDALVGALGALRTPDATTLRRWRSSLDPAASERAAGCLLRGLAVRLDDPTDPTCESLLANSAALFATRGDHRGEAGALSALTYVQHVRRDAVGLRASYARLVELADAGVGEAEDQRRLAGAVTATAAGALDKVEALVRPILDGATGRAARGLALWLHFNARNGLGWRSVEIADELASIDVSLPGFAVAQLSARWRAGELDTILSDPGPVPTGDRDRFLHAVWMTFVSCGFGDDARTDALLADVRAGAGEVSRFMGDGSDILPEVAVSAERGDTDAAARLLREMVAAHPLDGPSHGFYVMALGLVYPLLPEFREHFDGLELGDLFSRDLALNRALVAAVEEGDVAPVRSLALPLRASELLPSLGLRRTAELLAAAWSVDHPDAAELVQDLAQLLGERARTSFRHAAESNVPAIAAGAKGILTSIPVEPTHTLGIRLLGGPELVIDGTVVDTADWRRSPVRNLLAFLVLNAPATRDQAIAALWPEVDSDAGRRRLRSTLNRLNSVLEPQRGSGDAPFFVRSVGPTLRLVPGGVLDIDIEVFETAADEGERLDAEGLPSLAIEPYLRAVDAYPGDLLPEAYDDWLLVPRDRLRSRFVRTTVRCAELLVASSRPGESAVLAARAIEAEPWSEPAHRALVSAHLAAGDVAAARRALTTCDVMLEEFGGATEDATIVLRRRLDRSGPA